MKQTDPDDCARAYMTIRTWMVGQVVTGWLAAHAEVIPSEIVIADRVVTIADAIISRLNRAE